jgi:hypothetical protein
MSRTVALARHDFLGLDLGRGEQFVRCALRGVRGAGHAFGGVVDAAHQHGEFLNRVIHRVGNGARDVFRHRGAHREVAVGQVAHFVHQPQNGALGGVLFRFGDAPLLFGLAAAPHAFVVEGLDHQHQHQQRDGAEDRGGEGREVLLGDFLFVGFDQAGGVSGHGAEAVLQPAPVLRACTSGFRSPVSAGTAAIMALRPRLRAANRPARLPARRGCP